MSSSSRPFDANLVLFLVFFFFFFLSMICHSYSNPVTTLAYFRCGTVKSADTNSFIKSYIKGMGVLLDNSDKNRSGHSVIIQDKESPFYAAVQCYSGFSDEDCQVCFFEGRTRLLQCFKNSSISGAIFLDGCFLRYDNYNFFNESINENIDGNICNKTVLHSENLNEEFSTNAKELMSDLIEIAAKKSEKRFGMNKRDRGDSTVYGFVQCWENLNEESCRGCLQKGWKNMKRCLPERQSKEFNAGCYMRYSDQLFYYQTSDEGMSILKIIVIILSCCFVSMVVMFLSIFSVFRRGKRKTEMKHSDNLSNREKSYLRFNYEMLEKATNYFGISNKLGEGSAGTVYKATLPDGRTVAVKRLFFHSKEWVSEFFNEVDLISGIDHENLVKLLGCSIEGPESLLVYEYLSNKSLDQFLSCKGEHILTWDQRLNIVVGIAKGLEHLHEGTKVRIIHRDIKSSNILLDENLMAKIADFGLVRRFASDKSHLTTKLAGTFGYIAPEYLVRGQLTEKVDVYSFGVLILKIVCGQRVREYIHETGSFLETAWRSYKSNTLEIIVDSKLKEFPKDEVRNVIQVGLLCAQATAALRPSMGEVVKLLTEEDYRMQSPTQPPFLRARSSSNV